MNFFRSTDCNFVVRVLRARVDRLDDDENVLKLRTDALWGERQSARFLEDDGYDVVADVTFSEQLLSVVGGEGKHCRDVEHYFAVLVLGID